MSRIMSAVTSPMPVARSLRHSSFKGQGRCGRPLNFAAIRTLNLRSSRTLNLQNSRTLNFAELRDFELAELRDFTLNFAELLDFELCGALELCGAPGL